MTTEEIEDSIMFVSYLTLVMAGANIIWGMFLYPWGIIGFIFAAINIVTFFIVKSAHDHYQGRNYEKARSKMKVATVFGFLFALIIPGIYGYKVYRTLDNIVERKYLIKSNYNKEIYAPPQFPRNKK